jgi:hypothetical protein
MRRAQERKRSLSEVLDRYGAELQSLKAIIEVIGDEDLLQTASVNAELATLKEVHDRLAEQLKALDVSLKNDAKQFIHQFVHGSDEERRLAVTMAELTQVKATLLLRIQVANGGIIRTVKNIAFVNAGVINRIDAFLKEELGDGVGLKIAELVKGRRLGSMYEILKDSDTEH